MLARCRHFWARSFFALSLPLISQTAAAQVTVVVVHASADCADGEALNTLGAHLQVRMADALVVVEGGDALPSDTSVMWDASGSGCGVSVTSSAGQTWLALPRGASEDAIHDVAVRVAWLAGYGATAVFGLPSEPSEAASPVAMPADPSSLEVANTGPEDGDALETQVAPNADAVVDTSEQASFDADNADAVVDTSEQASFDAEPDVTPEAEPETTHGGDEVLDEPEPEETALGALSEELTTILEREGEELQEVLRRAGVGVSMVPGWERPRWSGFGAVRSFSFGLVNGTSGIEGVELGMAANLTDGDVSGLQLSAGVNVVTGRLHGVQGAGALNVATSMEGVQLGAVNVLSGPSVGIQAGTVNLANELVGTQLGTVNLANEVDGAQLGLANVAGEASSQGGLVNLAGDVDFQVGLFNLARSSDVSLGLISVVTSEPVRLYGAINEHNTATIGVRHGSRYVQSILELGFPLGGEPQRYGVGLGEHSPITGALWLEMDMVFSATEASLLGQGAPILGELRATAGYQIAPRFAVFAGTTGYVLWASRPTGGDVIPVDVTPEELAADSFLMTWPGGRVGIRF